MDVAVKKIFMTTNVNLMEQAEVKWMQRARHPRLVLFFGMGKHPDQNVFVVIEYMRNGDLLHLLTSSYESERPITWVSRIRLLLDVAEGMNCT